MRLRGVAEPESPALASSSARVPARVQAWLGVALVAAFVLRAVVGLATYDRGPRGPGRDWWLSGYSAYGEMAVNLAEDRGLRRGARLAPRPPLYPLLLAGVHMVGGRGSTLPILVQAAVGTGTVAFAYLIGRTVLTPMTGLVAATMAAAYPYYVVHDTAHQETSLFTLLTAATIYALLRARRSASLGAALLAGVLAGLALLCRESLLPFVPLAALWLARPAAHTLAWSDRARAAVFLSVTILMVTPWLARNAHVYGTPVFSGGAGFRAWIGHNDATLSHYPWESIDRSTEEAFDRMTPSERSALAGLGELERDRWFLRRAVAFVVADPARFLRYSAVKVFAAFGPFRSPLGRSQLENVVYTLSYVTVAVLAVIGLRAAAGRDLVGLVALLTAGFAVVAVAAHAHTSHRSHLDVHLMVLAAAAVTRRWPGRWAGAAA
jgi:4-amino-4-deoxy-L-arabinose transferase-like glycosyltransferase